MRSAIRLMVLASICVGCAQRRALTAEQIDQATLTLRNPLVTESSGMAVSRRDANILWTHNDSGDAPTIYAFNLDGTPRGRFTIPGTWAIDFEDMASLELDGRPMLLIGDIGDNLLIRGHVTLYLVREPELTGIDVDAPHKLDVVMRINVRYPDGKADCEAVAFDPTDRSIYLIAKVRDATEAGVYRLTLPDKQPDAAVTLDRIGAIRLQGVAAMDMTADGLRAVVLARGQLHEFERQPGESWQQAFARPPKTVGQPLPRGCEAAAYSPDGRTIYVTAEGDPCRLWIVPRE